MQSNLEYFKSKKQLLCSTKKYSKAFLQEEVEEYWKTHFRRKQALVKVQKSTPRKQCKSKLPILVNPLLIVRNHGSFVLSCAYSEIVIISMDVMQEASPQLQHSTIVYIVTILTLLYFTLLYIILYFSAIFQIYRVIYIQWGDQLPQLMIELDSKPISKDLFQSEFFLVT